MIIDHRYKTIEYLGSGAWGVVNKVIDLRTGNIYSLKLFKSLSSSAVYEKFSAEDMHHITKIEHPNLAHIIDFGHVGDHIYYVSEFFEGVSLKNFRFSKSHLEIFFDIIVQICYALDALHTQKIIHKDLKADNILFKQEGNKVDVKVIDYGFTRIDTKNNDHKVSGTLFNIAPEIFWGKAYTPASDFYSLGVVLYNIVTGKQPFTEEKIKSLIEKPNQYFIPQFPSELNPEVTPALDNFILRLLERNPINRFQSAEEVISYINKIQYKQYPFSLEWSLVNTIKFNSYIARETYSHQLVDYVESIKQKNGRIVSIIGGDGLGKNSILSLFRYHHLTGEYNLFDYVCSRSDHDPFFALIKEYLEYMDANTQKNLDKYGQISQKFTKYLFQSEKEAKTVSQSPEELKADFESVRNIMIKLSELKPIIFIIRNAQYILRTTIDFLNYISPYVNKNRILIILSFNDYSKVHFISYSVIIQIPPLNRQETAEYINKLFSRKVPDTFVDNVWKISAGNPQFIREILIDLAQKKYILKNKTLDFSYNFSEYTLPYKTLHSIYARMSHLSETNYRHLQKLAIIETPLNRELMIYILGVSDRALYELLNDAIYNEVLCKVKQNYYFNYKEAKQRLISETTEEEHIRISQKVIDYYRKQRYYDSEVCLGIIKNAEISRDILAQREFYLKLYDLYEEAYDQDKAYHAIFEVLQLDFVLEQKITQKQLIEDLYAFQEKAEMTGYCYRVNEILPYLEKMPDIFAKHYVLGTLYLLMEEVNKAKEQFDKADALTVTGKQKILIWLYYCHLYARLDKQKMKYYLDKLSEAQMPLDLKVSFIDRYSVYYQLNNDLPKAIKKAEDFLAILPADQDAKLLIRLASMHNNLGVFYSIQKNIDEAEEHLTIALSIWKRFNIKRFWGLINNNLADLYLKQGLIQKAEDYSQQGFINAKEQGLKMTMALALLNMGEARIKMGEFLEADKYLNQSKQIHYELKSTKFLDSIQRNLALVKSKIISFGNYFQFIKENEPKLIEGIIEEINPLIKTYFYYLYELGNVKKINRLLRKNAHIDYHNIHEDEFYYNVQSLIHMLNRNYSAALEQLKNAQKFAGDVKNHYALTVFYIAEMECYIGLKDYTKANQIFLKAMQSATQYGYHYWEVKLRFLKTKMDLANVEIPLREILRELKSILQIASLKDYFILKIQISALIIQILVAMNAEEDAQKHYEELMDYIELITQNIDAEDKNCFITYNNYKVKSIKNWKVFEIPSRNMNLRANWNELQYSLLNIQNAERIKFFIDKGIRDIVAPWRYALMVYKDNNSSYDIFLSKNYSSDYSISVELYNHIEKSFKTDTIITTQTNDIHTMIVPLQIKTNRVGFLIVSDNGELNYTKNEIGQIKSIKQHLAVLMVRIQDYNEITQRIQKMNELMKINHNLLRIRNLSSLDYEIVSSCVDFFGSSRGFFIRKKEAQYNYEIAIDNEKLPLLDLQGVSKTVLSECQVTKEPIFTYNALADEKFANSISVQDYKLHSIFCVPLFFDQELYGIVYLDNYLDNSKPLYYNPEITHLLLEEINIALENALHYHAIKKKSDEMQSLDHLKDEFMAIISHELNTPLSSLSGYVSRLKKNLFVDEEERKEIISKIDANVKKLILTTNDILTMNSYNLKESLPKVPININDLIEPVLNSVAKANITRKMIFKTDIEDNLPPFEGNWEALHLLLYNILLNAIRFTNDFGTIIVGARKSTFTQEKLNNKESLVIYVQDNGIGIPEHQIEHVYRKFYELNEIYAHKSGLMEYKSSGLGLGLATAKRIVELHNGKIWIKSKENEGTTVYVSLPFKSE